MNKKIVTLWVNLSEENSERLSAIANLEILDSPSSVDDLVSKVEWADMIYSNWAYLLESLSRLKNVFVTYPYVELGVFDTEELSKNWVTIANAEGWNRESVIEWVMYMVLMLFRKLSHTVRATEDFPVKLEETLVAKKVLIVGHWSFGTQIWVLCKAFWMDVSFFDRWDNLTEKSRDSDLIINSLNCNTSSENLLEETFFMNLKKWAYYLTFVRPYTYDLDWLIKSIDAWIVAWAAIDCDPEKFGDTTNVFYQKALSNSKILVTPHIAFSTKQAIANGAEIAIQNIEKFIDNEPQNILAKK